MSVLRSGSTCECTLIDTSKPVTPTLVSVTCYDNLAIYAAEFDWGEKGSGTQCESPYLTVLGKKKNYTVTVPFLLTRVDGPIPVLRDVPTRFEELAFIVPFFVQRITHRREDLRVRASLHRQHLTLVVVSYRLRIVWRFDSHHGRC